MAQCHRKKWNKGWLSNIMEYKIVEGSNKRGNGVLWMITTLMKIEFLMVESRLVQKKYYSLNRKSAKLHENSLP